MHMWCPAFFSHLFTRGFTTNNYVEGLNNALKQQLVLRPNLRVDSMFGVIFKSFTVKYVKRHLDLNMSSSDGRKFRKKTFPTELGIRPVCVLEGLLARQTKAEKIPLGDIDTSKAPLGIYRFQKNKTVLRAEHEFALAKKRGEEMEVEAAMEKERAMQGANATLNTPS